MLERSHAILISVLSLSLTFVGGLAHASLVLDDTLQNSTSGTREGGAFVSGGWQVTTKNDTIYWHVPTITNGAVEFEVRGLYPNECRAGMEDKTELFHMYGNATVNTTGVFIQWTGDPHTRYRVRVTRVDNPDLAIAWDSGEVKSDRDFAWAGRLLDLTTYYVFVQLGDSSQWSPWSPPGHTFRVDTTSVPPGANLVQISGKTFRDQNGPFLGLGASYFQALRRAKYDRARLNSDLALLASKGFNYVRILSMVNWDTLEIAPVSFTNSAGHFVPGWPDYWQQFRDLLEVVALHGLRAEITIFADAQYVMPGKSTRQAHLDGILSNIAGREQNILHLEVANEAWQNGFPGSPGVADLREFAQYLSDRTSVPVAITSNDDLSDSGIISLYSGSAADLATVHFSRDIGTVEGGWLPVRDCYRAGDLPSVPPVTSNEPIGPGSSVSSENDPSKLCAAAVFAYIANLPGYVYHSRAGVFGYVNCCPPSGGEVAFVDTAGINAYQFIRQILPSDLASWVRNDGLESSAPFTIFCDGQPNQYWPDVINPSSGCDRNIGSTKGKEFVCLPMGILSGGVTLQARRPMQFQVFNPLSGEVVSNITMSSGNSVTLPPGPGAYVLKGSFLDSFPPGCEPWTQFLDGSSLPAPPWQPFQDGGTEGTTLIVDFFDPELGVTNQALRINSGLNANEWFVGLGAVDELAAGARFRVVALSPAGKENLLCLTTHSTPLSPAPAVTLVNGRYKLWSYVNSDTEILDLGPVVTNEWHTTYLYARADGKVQLWWDGVLAFDDMAPLVNPFDAYVEWGSGAWQFNAATTVDFDWVAYGNACNLPQPLKITRNGKEVVVSWSTNALGFVLQSSATLLPPNWTDATNIVWVAGSENVVTNSLAVANEFFRLRKSQ